MEAPKFTTEESKLLLRLLKANSDKAVAELTSPTGYLDLVVKLKELVNVSYLEAENPIAYKIKNGVSDDITFLGKEK